jgi:hypothetical protein
MNAKFRDRYIKAQIALKELLECDKTISHIDVFITKERNVIIAFDLMGSTQENEKLVTKVKDFVPDFVLEKYTEEKS